MWAQLNGAHLGLGVLIAGGLTAIAVSNRLGRSCRARSASSPPSGRSAWPWACPLGVLPLLLAVEVIPDIFRTVGNVTADLAATRIVAGRDDAAATPDIE